METDILKPDTGVLSIERPLHASSKGSSTSDRPESSGLATPEFTREPYAEPVSEGEEDEEMDLATAKDEGKITGLTGPEVAAAVAFREKALKERAHDNVASSPPRGSQNGVRTRNAAHTSHDSDAEDDEDEEGSEGETDSGMEEITGKGKGKEKAVPAKKKTAPRKSKAKADEKGKEKEDQGEDKMDVDGDSSKLAGSPEAKSLPAAVTTPTSAPPKRRGRPPKRRLEEQPTEDGTESTGTVTPAPKRRGRPPKSKPLIEDSDVETRVTGPPSSSPTRGGKRTPRSDSLNSGRKIGNVGRIAAEFDKRSTGVKRTPKSRLGVAVTAGDDADVEMTDDQQKKKRKVAS